MATSPAKASTNLSQRAMLFDFGYPRTSSPMLYGKGSSLGFVRSYFNCKEYSLFCGRPSGLERPSFKPKRIHTETLSESFLNKLKALAYYPNSLFLNCPGDFRVLLQIKLWASF